MPGTPPIKARSQQDYTDLSRSVAANHFHTEMKKVTEAEVRMITHGNALWVLKMGWGNPLPET